MAADEAPEAPVPVPDTLPISMAMAAYLNRTLEVIEAANKSGIPSQRPAENEKE